MSPLFFKSKVKEVDPAETKRRLDSQSALVVDVREADEWREGHIAGAKHIPLGQIRARSAEIMKAPEVVFVCRSGSRSASAADALTKAGHANAYDMAGGMLAWKRQNLPVKH